MFCYSLFSSAFLMSKRCLCLCGLNGSILVKCLIIWSFIGFSFRYLKWGSFVFNIAHLSCQSRSDPLFLNYFRIGNGRLFVTLSFSYRKIYKRRNSLIGKRWS